MATEQASSVTTTTTPSARWASWLAALVGLWVLVSPFVLTGAIASGAPMWSNVLAGLAVLILAGFAAYRTRQAGGRATGSMAEWSGWIAALAGLWMLLTPFIMTGPIATGGVMSSNVIAGVVTLVLAGYLGYKLQSA